MPMTLYYCRICGDLLTQQTGISEADGQTYAWYECSAHLDCPQTNTANATRLEGH